MDPTSSPPCLTAGEAKNCLLCLNLLAGPDTEFCRVYGERILDPHSAAEDCPSFEDGDL